MDLRRAAIVALVLASAAAVRADPPAAHQTVVLFFELVNVSDRPAEDVRLWATLPASCRYQEVHSMRVHPAPAQQGADRLGQTRAAWRIGRLEPGQGATVAALVQATLKPVRVDFDARPADPLTPPQKADYLRDDPQWLQLAEASKLSRKWVATPSKDPTERARQIFDALRGGCRYVLDNKRDTAVDVLKGGKGSCTELGFAFIALCRANGVPARMASAWVNRRGATAAVDTVNHRWPEFWDDRCGWAPADLSRAVSHANSFPLSYRRELYFGRIPADFLVVVDDGVRRPGHDGWRGYALYCRRGWVRVSRASAWQSTGDAAAERALFERACEQIGPAGEARGDRLAAWADDKTPLARFLLLPMLNGGSGDLRLAAADRLADADDPTTAGPLLARARTCRDDAFRDALVERVAHMLKRPEPAFRCAVLREIGRGRVAQTRPLAEAARKDDANWLVRWTAGKALEKLDAAEGERDEE